MIITLCGSARFEPWYHAWNEALSLAGHCVFGLASYPSMHGGKKDWYTPAQKGVLDAVHRGKIRHSDAILVLNVFAYMGESTLGEIEHARALGKETYFLESWGAGCGIGASHFEHTRTVRDRFNVPHGFGPPIDTVASMRCRVPWDLLGSGEWRSAIVYGLRARLADVADGWGCA